MKQEFYFGTDYDSYWDKNESSDSFFYNLCKELFNEEESGSMSVECFFEGDYTNSWKIQRVIRHVTGRHAIVKDYIDDNGYLRSIDIKFLSMAGEESLPEINIVVTCGVEDSLSEEQYYDELDPALYSDNGMDYMYAIALDAIYTLYEHIECCKSSRIKDNKFTYYVNGFDLWHAENKHNKNNLRIL